MIVKRLKFKQNKLKIKKKMKQKKIQREIKANLLRFFWVVWILPTW
jgi:hypothetical protein